MRAVVCMAVAWLALAGAAVANPLLPGRLTREAVDRVNACSNWTDVSQRAWLDNEAVARRGQSRILRRGDVLRIGRNTWRDAHGEQEMDRTRYRYVGRLLGAPVDVVLYDPYEGHAYVLVDEPSGDTATVPGLPALSPSGARLAAPASDPTFDQAGLVLLGRAAGGFVALARFPALRYPCALVWRSEERLELQVGVGPSSAGPGQWAPAAIVHTAAGWIFEGPPAAAEP
jgi:hypothetical protein